MITAMEILSGMEILFPVVVSVTVLVIAFLAFELIIKITKARLLQKATTRTQITNIELFSKILKYSAIILLIVFAVFTYFGSGSWAGLGIWVGLLSAAIGFALQKPIAGIAAWLMMITKRPFQIGDRIMIGNLKGDVTDITITHIYLGEIGGLVPGEEGSGRIILIPNSILFEQNIINYSSQREEIILDEVVTTVTYESNLEKATEILLNAANKFVSELVKNPRKEPYVRTFFQPSGINIHIRYFAPLKKMQSIASAITKEIHNQVMKTNNVEFAYPHTEFVIKDKSLNDKWKHRPLLENHNPFPYEK